MSFVYWVKDWNEVLETLIVIQSLNKHINERIIDICVGLWLFVQKD